MAGAIRNSAGVSFDSMRVLGSFAVVLLTGGAGRYAQPGVRPVSVLPGDVIVIMPTLPHAYGPQPRDTWHEIYLVFDGPLFDCWHDELQRVQPIVRTGAVEPWERRFRDVAAAPTHLTQMALLQTMLAQLIDFQTQSLTPSTKWFDRAQQLLAGPAKDPKCDPKAVARALGVGNEVFRKTFKRLAGVSPGRFRESAVLRQAASLLLKNDHTLADIAEQTGYCDAFHFSKRFKQTLGISPTQYRHQAGIYSTR